MSETGQLGGLIQDLRKSNSRIEQLKILTRAWKTVHGLSQTERLELAKHIGMREGLPLLERLGKPGGVSPAALAQAVFKAEQSSPGQLNQILRDLRTPSSRARGIRESVAMLDSVLEETAPPAKGVQVNSAQPPLAPPLVRPDHPTVSAGSPAESGLEPASVKSPPAETQPTKPKLEPVSQPVASVQPPLQPPVERESPFASLNSVQNPSYPETPAWGRPFGLTEENPLPSPQAMSATAWSTSGLMKSFRKLDQMIDRESGLEDRLESVLAGLPPGWPRRRALAQLIRTGAVSETSSILAAIAALPSQFDEFWCLSAWLHANEPNRAELEEALRQTRGPAGRRLLKARLSRR